MLAAGAMKAAMAVLVPKIAVERMREAWLGKVVIGTILDDIHDIGKNLVVAMLSAARFDVYDLGIDIPPKKFVEKAEELDADIIAVSSLITASMLYQRDLIKLLE